MESQAQSSAPSAAADTETADEYLRRCSREDTVPLANVVARKRAAEAKPMPGPDAPWVVYDPKRGSLIDVMTGTKVVAPSAPSSEGVALGDAAEAERLAAWLEKIAAGFDPVGPEYANAAAMLRKLARPAARHTGTRAQYKAFAQKLRDGDMLEEPLNWPHISEQIHMAADTIDALIDGSTADIEQILDDHDSICINDWDAKYGADCSLAQAIRAALEKPGTASAPRVVNERSL